MTKVKQANIITMGCSKNLVDSEKLAWQLMQQGWEVEHEAEHWNHDIVFINTCGFINDAKEESVQMILDLAEAKNLGQIKTIVVFGCLVQRYPDDLKEEIPEVDYWMGNYSRAQMMKLLRLESSSSNERINSADGHYAYLKIAEGCDRKCAFCAIPLIKGKYISRPMDELLAEAKYLASEGVKELLIIAQDLSFYGHDMQDNELLPTLVQALSEIEGIEWIRLHYLYPNAFPEAILSMMAENPKLCAYLDIPLQHVNDEVLKRMRRSTNKKETERILSIAREKVPNISLRTTMLVGHPGETEEAFQELLEFVKKWKFDRLGVFTYSEEEGTFGAKSFEDSIPEDVKEDRANQIMEIQEQISADLNKEKIGQKLKIIVDRREAGWYYGRSEHDSVEVDNEILFETEKFLEPGTFCEIEITDASAFELEGKLLKILD
ncbi:MAG: 30S ribosomal protein S12 methylthiotransferase RimO [Bacteroidales bacterium]|nr:30S ribosomal protein S12 methylthiotransferase RimO [Bacteroidales bacterium]